MPGLGDLLHLVSGQTLLGAVRERHARNLSSAWHGAAHVCDGMGGSPQLDMHQQESDRTACSHASMHGLAEGIRVWPSSHDCNAANAQNSSISPRGACHSPCGSERQPEFGMASKSNSREHQDSSSRGGSFQASQQPADVLDLFLEDKHVATAVRERWTEPAEQSASMGSRIHPAGRQGSHDGPEEPSGLAAAAAAGMNATPNGATEAAEPGASSGRIAIFRAEDEGGSPLCSIDQRSGRITTSAQLRAGVHHQMISSATPLVRSLHFVVHTGALRQLRHACQAVFMGATAPVLHGWHGPQTHVCSGTCSRDLGCERTVALPAHAFH